MNYNGRGYAPTFLYIIKLNSKISEILLKKYINNIKMLKVWIKIKYFTIYA